MMIMQFVDCNIC